MIPIADLHMHTFASFDGRGSAEDMARTAFENGASCICFTEHYDELNLPTEDPEAFDNRPYYLEHESAAKEKLAELQERYRGKMKVLYGVELGQGYIDPNDALAFLDARPFDYVIGSVHNISSGRDYYLVDYSQTDPISLLEKYYEDNLKLIRFEHIDTVAHLDYPVRVMKGFINPELKYLREAIAAVLSAAIEKGLPLEINTKTRYSWAGRQSPETWVLNLFKDLGGSFVTLGSDAHCPEQVLRGIQDAYELATSLGLRVAVAYDQHTPLFAS